MLAVHYDVSGRDLCFVLIPDFGGVWRHTVMMYCSLAVTSLTVAMAFVAMGFWPVLPFAGLELAALGVALYVSARRGAIREVIRVSEAAVVVESGLHRPEKRQTFDRFWSSVELSKSRGQWHPGRLVLRSGTRRLEVGAFLDDEERENLARELAQAVGPMAAAGCDAPGGAPQLVRA